MPKFTRITPKELDLLGPQAVVIDVREPGEFAVERWPGSVNVPLSSFEKTAADLPPGRPIVVLCRSGRRACEAADRLAARGFLDVRVVDGGLVKCARENLEKGPGGAWAMERQVRLAAGSLVLSGAVLGWLAHPGFWLICAGVGAGLVFSALTDTCGMAAVLSRMPWNKGRS